MTVSYFVYSHDYERDPEFEGGSMQDAIDFIFALLPSDDFVYMVGTNEGIEAMVFQGRVYR